MSRINFASNQFADLDKPGVRSIINRVRSSNPSSPEDLVDLCLDFIGPIHVNEETRLEIVEQAGSDAALDSTEKVLGILQLIVASPEFQLA